jgi:hypothetical protein
MSTRHSRERQRYGRVNDQADVQMILLYLSIPIMVLAIAIATFPLVLSIRREELKRREALALPLGADTSADIDEELRRAA